MAGEHNQDGWLADGQKPSLAICKQVRDVLALRSYPPGETSFNLSEWEQLLEACFIEAMDRLEAQGED